MTSPPPSSTPRARGVAYATYRIFADGSDKPLVSNTSSLDGEIAQTVSKAGAYTLQLSYVGMRDTVVAFKVSPSSPRAALGRLTMREASEMLAGVTVTAQKPLVVKEIDRVGYDVQADPDTKTSNLRDILRKVPMVTVEADGTILVNGSSNFKIYKNGRPNNSMSRNAKDLFAALPASMIKKIEVITEPGAEHDAEGTTAILNIVTVENTAIKGVMGNVNLDYRTTTEVPFLGLWLTSQIDKVTMSAYGGYAHLSGKQGRQRSESEIIFPESGNRRLSSSSSKFDGDFGYFGLEASYELDTLNLFTAEVSGYSNNVRPRSTGSTFTYGAAGDVLGSYNSASTARYNRYFDVDANINYQHSTRRKGETYTLSYMLSTTNQSSDQTSTYSDFYGIESQPYSGVHSKYNLNFIEHTFQGDWNRPIGNHTVNAGLKWIIRRNHSTNDNDYFDWQTVNSDFEHVTNIGAAYAQYGYRVGPVSMRAGLRYEYSRLKASYPDGKGDPFSADLNDLVPSAAVSWQVNDANSLSVNYASSISRPGISYLNPSQTIAPGSMSFGNPDLESARRQSVKLTYMLIKQKFNINFSADYAFVNNGIAGIQYLTDGDIITSTYANIGKTRQVNFNAYVQWSITPKTRLMLNGGVRYEHNSQQGLSLSRWSPRGFAQLSQELPWKLRAELAMFYWSGGLDGVYGYSVSRFSQNAYHSLSLSRAFLKGDRLNVRLSVQNFLGGRTRCYESRVVNGEYLSTTRQYNDHAFNVAINIGWRFGSLNAHVKKTARSIDNDDLVGRKSGGGESQGSQQGGNY
ncbi:MAG: outer membrane beta-barrel family protein [Bacteroidales bacterium]|nr:outer membrane beta-barrel family protein [Bacteroidales bacterium]